MTLLEPAAALIAGAIALPALAVLYLLKLRRRPVRVSSTLLWQQAYEDLEANVPWRWVRPSWLVLLHLLLVALLVLAIGRPAIGDGGAAPSKIIIVLDRSASMNAADGVGGGTRFDEARTRALRVIDDAMRLGRRVEAAVIAAAADPVALTQLTTDRRLLRAAVESASTTDQPLDLNAALELASGMVGAGEQVTSESAAPGPEPMILVFSDGSVAGSDAAAPPGVQVRLERVGPSPAGLASATGAPAIDVDNLGITRLSARRDAENPAVVRVFVEVINASRRPRDVACLISLDRTEQARRPMSIPAATDTGPGTASITFELSSRGGGVVEVELVAQDLLAADNRAWLVLAPPRSPAILVVVPADSDPAGDAGQVTPTWVLENVLAELRSALLRTVTQAQAPAALAGAASTYDLVVFDRVEPAGLPPVSSIVLGSGMAAAGVTLEPPQAPGERDFVLTWERSHPLLRDVSLDSVYTVGGSFIAAPTPGLRPTDLATGVSGPLVLLVESGSTKYLFAPDLERSNWGLQVGFAIFLANAVDYLTLGPETQSGVARRIADPIEAAVPRGMTSVTMTGAATRTIELPPPPSADAAQVRTVSLGRVERTGRYDLPAGVSPAVVGINLLDETETALATADQLPVRVRGSTAASAEPPVPREISRDLLLAALVVLVIEWIVYARTARS
ncbi:MAG: hypothetical protein GIKADHBN_00336 [Phycisphaerales bacterium]|nr:hypothetical protein [Phycisphaerales bacterium]